MHTKAIAPSRECAAAWPILNEDLLGTQPLTVCHISSASPAALRTQLVKDNCTNSLLNYGAELVASYGPFSIQERIWACTTRSRRGKGLVVRCPGAAPRSTSAVTTSMRLGTGPRSRGRQAIVPGGPEPLTSERGRHPSNIQGGRETDLTVGVIWYPDPGIRHMANWINVLQLAAPFDRSYLNGMHPNIFLMRAQVNW